MDLPKNNKKLDQIFINGSEPSIEEFADEYWVKMLTGIIPNFRWAGHRKHFSIDKVNKTGRNIILFNNSFGYFKVQTGQCEDLNDLKAVVLNYGGKRNFLTRSVRDKIRMVENGLYLGRYYSVINDDFYFKGYFSLKKR